jgi:hypothetical protein
MELCEIGFDGGRWMKLGIKSQKYPSIRYELMSVSLRMNLTKLKCELVELLIFFGALH